MKLCTLSHHELPIPPLLGDNVSPGIDQTSGHLCGLATGAIET